MRRLCFYMCLSVILFTGGVCMAGGCMAGGMCGWEGHGWGACVAGGVCGWEDAWLGGRACVAGGTCVAGRGMAGGMRGWGRGNAWLGRGGWGVYAMHTHLPLPPDTTRYGRSMSGWVRILLECILVTTSLYSQLLHSLKYSHYDQLFFADNRFSSDQLSSCKRPFVTIQT